MFFFILLTYLLDIVLILLGEILSWSLVGVKGLRIFLGKKWRADRNGGLGNKTLVIDKHDKTLKRF